MEKKGDLTLFHTFPTLPSETSKQQKKKNDARKPQPTTTKASEKSVKALLGELYADRQVNRRAFCSCENSVGLTVQLPIAQYIEELLEDPSFVTVNAAEENDSLRDLLSTEKSYLEKRTEFWRQQKPIYAIKNERLRNLGLMTSTLTTTRSGTAAVDTSGELTREDIWRGMEEIEHSFSDGYTEDALDQAKDLRGRVEVSTVPSRLNYLAMLSSLVGTALFDLQDYETALTE